MDSEYLKYMNEFDPQTFRKLMEAYGQDVWNYAYFLTRNRHNADDISQEVFIKTYQHIASYRGAAPVKHWLFAITRNTTKNYQKKSVLLPNDSC